MNGLTVLRQLFLSFSSALVLITVVAVILSTSIGHVDPPTSVSMTIVIVVGLASLIAGRRARRELDCGGRTSSHSRSPSPGSPDSRRPAET